MSIISSSEYVEKSLNCILPKDYASFLNKYGYSTINGNEIFGYSTQTVDIEKIPCVIGATHIYRKLGRISSKQILIYINDDTLYGYDLNKKEYFVKDVIGNYKLAESIF